MAHTNSIRNCDIEGCNHVHHAKGMCSMHYHRQPVFVARERIRTRSDKKRIYNKTWKLANPEKAKLHRLTYYRRKSYKRVGKQINYVDPSLIENYFSRVCGICGLVIEHKFEVDHIIPLSRGGIHVSSNLQFTHPICNRTKHTRLQNEMELDIIMLRELIQK